MILGIYWIAAGCARSTESARPRETSTGARLGSWVAQVGDQPIELETLKAITRAQSLPMDEAQELAIRDALLAEAAAGRLPEHYRRQVRRAVLARLALDALAQEAEQQGEPSAAEISEIVGLRLWDFERPQMFRTIHAVVLAEEGGPQVEARQVAERIRDAVSGAENAEDFRKQAEDVARGDLQVRVETLPPVAADGRAFDPKDPPKPGQSPSQFDRAFAEAAASLTAERPLSHPIRSKFGFHVIRLLEVLPEHWVPPEERPSMVREEVLRERAAKLHRELIDRARTEFPPVVLDQAMSLTEQIQVGP